jgi:hypothetical protein
MRSAGLFSLCLVVKGVRRHKAILIAHAVKRFHLITLIGGENG